MPRVRFERNMTNSVIKDLRSLGWNPSKIRASYADIMIDDNGEQKPCAQD